METTAETPKVSFCSQIYNQTDLAPKMFETIIAQTYPNWELIVVDDGSKDESLKALVESYNDPRIIFHRFDENKGVPFGTNWALRKATGKYICLAAADEYFHPDKLKVQVDFLEANPNIDCCWGLPGNGDDNFPMGPRPEWEQYAMQSHNRSNYAWVRTLVNLETVPIGGCGLLMKKSVADALGGLDENLRTFSDHEFYTRFFEQGYVGVIIPFRVAIDRPIAENVNSVRMKNQEKAQEEHEYVKRKHPIVPPPTDGKICVGIACYNYAKYLKDCVDSILAQTRQVDEIIIVDDGSTDNFDEVALQFTDKRIKLKKMPENVGMQEATNYMAFTTECDFFVSVAADDKLHPTYIEKVMNEFVKNPWLEFVASQTDFYNEDWTPLKGDMSTTNSINTEKEKVAGALMNIPKPVNHENRHQFLATLRPGNQYFGAGTYRTYAIKQVGGWEKEFKVISDYQMYLKLLQRENIRIVEEDLTHTRVHYKNHSLMEKDRHKELPSLYHNARKRFWRQPIKLVIATPFYELKAFSPYVVSLQNTCRLLTSCGIDWRFMELSGDSYVHRARNTMCDYFLQDPDTTDLFFIDSDMSWDPEALVKMVLLPDDVVGAAYPVKNKWDAWTSIPKVYNENGQNVMHGRPLDADSALIEADVLAGGFLRIKRHVLEKFREHYTDKWYTEPSTMPEEPQHRFTEFFVAEKIDGQFFGEDHAFSKRLRDMGTRMFIYPKVDLIHWGYKAFDGNYHNYLKAKKDTAEKEQRMAA